MHHSVNMGSISLLVVFAGLCALAYGYHEPNPIYTKTVDKDFLYKQKSILEVLQHVHQHEVLPALYEQVKSFRFEDFYDHYTNVEAVREFVKLYEFGLLPRDEIFTVYNEYHRYQVVALFHVFYYAKDFETFYKSVLWARFNVNEGMFVYALNVAVMHRPDMVGIDLPAPYEIYPYYFFNTQTIQTAQSYKMQGFSNLKKVEGVHTVIIPTNYTGYYYKTNEDTKISYFTEDIGLNTYYYYFHARYPFWMGSKEFNFSKDRRGELYLFEHQQLLARYYLERLSNGLGEIPEFSFFDKLKTGYYPELRYYNGIFFPTRDNFYNLYTEQNYYDIDLIEDYERRIRDAIDYGFIVLPDGTHFDFTKPESIELLGNLIQGNPDSYNKRFYGYFSVLAQTVFGGAFTEHHHYHRVIPSVLEQFETSMRDPVFYQLYKRIIKLYWQFKNFLPTYSRSEIEFPGVKVESVEMDKLVTYFDNFDADITNAVDVDYYKGKSYDTSELFKFGKIASYQGEDFVIKARQYRLNHTPFTFKLNVFAEKAFKSVVRVFFGPKYDEFGHAFNIHENRENFVLFDQFKYDLVSGKNVISRLSRDYSWYVNDYTTYFDLYKNVMLAYSEKFTYKIDSRQGLPNRLLLPKGKKGGMPFQFFFIVTPYVAGFESSSHVYEYGKTGFVDALPFGYPFDRKIDESVWYTPNMFYYEVNVFHKTENEIDFARF